MLGEILTWSGVLVAAAVTFLLYRSTRHTQEQGEPEDRPDE